ncbi:interleukin 12Ba precursor [Echeneis naucrates]|uniref:Interleukin-12 subunit beta n=1 Tax=Echeneis naucrates TaxID=173247 RepID=A0A665WFT6_ECHNA|nr:interleukin-12 subunit beta-like [Echeneis naucrates]XP_029368635.1 interleukin-12 subunit beta-like [Echeneis naucrates]
MKMKLLVCIIIGSSFLQIYCQNPRNSWTLLPNILVVEVDGSLGKQTLSCLASQEEVMKRGQYIVWKKNGVVEPQKGNSYVVQLEESLGGGSYTCHSKDGSLLNHTVVLIQEDETQKRKILVETDEGDYLKCSAQNYSGTFHCSWTWHKSRVGKVAFIKAWRISDENETWCYVDTDVQRWRCSTGQSNFSCSVDESGHGISCMDEQHCPYAEESQQIFLTIFVRTEHFLVESYSKHFYLSEIVKPDKVRISKINTTMVEWSYPSSWNSPYSYFPLTFQILQLRRGCKSCNPCAISKPTKNWRVHSTDRCQFPVKPAATAVCVRAKDAFCNSQWSEWSHLRLGRGKKSTKQRRQ